MDPIKTPASNFTFLPPPGMRDCDPLHVQRTEDRIISVWQPTPEERKAIAGGANVELHVWGRGTPPVALVTTHLQKVE